MDKKVFKTGYICAIIEHHEMTNKRFLVEKWGTRRMSMDTNTLLVFAKRIFGSCPPTKAEASIRQLKSLLDQQSISKETLELLDMMIESVPEMRETACRGELTRESVMIAARRAKERKNREQAARAYGRCC